MRGFGISFISFIRDMNNGLMVIYLLLEVKFENILVFYWFKRKF